MDGWLRSGGLLWEGETGWVGDEGGDVGGDLVGKVVHVVGDHH